MNRELPGSELYQTRPVLALIYAVLHGVRTEKALKKMGCGLPTFPEKTKNKNPDKLCKSSTIQPLC